MNNFTKTLMFPFVILACLGGAFIAWCGIVVIAIPGVIYAAGQVIKEMYEEG
jgi:hypothetical protein